MTIVFKVTYHMSHRDVANWDSGAMTKHVVASDALAAGNKLREHVLATPINAAMLGAKLELDGKVPTDCLVSGIVPVAHVDLA